MRCTGCFYFEQGLEGFCLSCSHMKSAVDRNRVGEKSSVHRRFKRLAMIPKMEV